jgi:DNA-binding GntR family transcriptional regulator
MSQTPRRTSRSTAAGRKRSEELATKPGLSLTEQAYEALRDDILHSRLPPGSSVAEALLADRFGVSKTPVREALRLLAHDGLVLVLPRKGYVVRPLGFDDVAEVFSLRILLEPGVAADAARRRLPHQATQFRAAAERFAAETEWREKALRSLELHELLCEIAGAGRRERIVLDLVFEAHRFWLLEAGAPASNAEWAEPFYEQIADAVTEGSSDDAAAAMLAMLERSRSLLVGGWVNARVSS